MISLIHQKYTVYPYSIFTVKIIVLNSQYLIQIRHVMAAHGYTQQDAPNKNALADIDIKQRYSPASAGSYKLGKADETRSVIHRQG